MRIWNRNFTLITLSNCLTILSYMMLSATYPLYLVNLGYAQDLIGLMVGVFTVTAMLVRPLTGSKLDTGNRKRIYFAGQMIAAVCFIAYPFADSIGFMSVVRMLHGVCVGITTTAANTIVTEFVPGSKMGEGLGYFGFGLVFSSAVGPALGLYLMESYGSLALFLVSSAIIAAGGIIGLWIIYTKRQQTVKTPASAERLWKADKIFERKAVRSAIVTMLACMPFYVASTFITIYAKEKQVDNIGLYFTVFALTLLVSRPLAGRMVDRIGYTAVFVPGAFCIGFSMVIIYFASSLWHFLVAAVCLSLGVGSVQNSLQTLAVKSSPEHRRGVALSTFFIGTDLSFLLGSTVGGIAAKNAGYDNMFLLSMVPVLIGLVVYFATGHIQKVFSRSV